MLLAQWSTVPWAKAIIMGHDYPSFSLSITHGSAYSRSHHVLEDYLLSTTSEINPHSHSHSHPRTHTHTRPLLFNFLPHSHSHSLTFPSTLAAPSPAAAAAAARSLSTSSETSTGVLANFRMDTPREKSTSSSAKVREESSGMRMYCLL
jgi:hypothetical protein